MNYSDKGKSFDKVRKEDVKPNLERREFEFFKYPASQAFSLTSEAHYHEAIECIIIDNGTLTVFNDGKWDNAKKGDMIVFRSMGAHAIFTNEEDVNDYYVLKIMPSVLYNATPKSAGPSFPLLFTAYNPNLKTLWKKEEIAGTQIELGLKRLISELNNDGKYAGKDISAIISALLIMEEIFNESASFGDTASRCSDAIFAAVAYIGTNLDQSLTEAAVAKKHNISESHFAREFKKATGKTFKDYLTFMRLNLATELLLSTSLPIGTVAARCGYVSTSYFIQLYKKYKGKTPSQERKS